jgi:hypothetical protein
MPSFKIRNASNTGWIDGATASGMRIRNASNTGWLNKTGTLSGVSVRNSANNNWLTFGSVFPSALTFTRNDLNFLYTETKTTTDPGKYMELIMTLDTTNFFNIMTRPDGHIVFAFDPSGDSSVFSGGTRDHCGQIVRNGQPLWDQARGFILLRTGELMAEQWYPGAGFALESLGTSFSPLTNPVFTVRLRAGYRIGPYGEKMEIDIFNGTSTSGSILAGSTKVWGWDYSGSHRFSLAAIGNFVDPSTTGCVETSAAGSFAGATIGISNFSFNMI